MSLQKKVLAIDFGASSGRAITGTFDGSKIELSEIHRFSNDSISFNGTLYWDTLHQLYEIKQGLLKSRAIEGIESIGIDTWGADFGLLDNKGFLLENPIHYRDVRTKGMVEAATRILSYEEIYFESGLEIKQFNTLFQLLAVKQKRPELLDRVGTFLMMPDLFNYYLTGEKHSEYTISSTTQLLDIKNHRWSSTLINKFGFPANIFREVIEPGTISGKLSAEICEDVGIKSIPVISVASHDTQSAIAAVPVENSDFAYISSGTWSIMGTELDSQVISEASMHESFSNEGGYSKKICYLKNITALWLIQESRRQWQRDGDDVSFADIESEARSARPFACFINTDSAEFISPGDIPRRIRKFCASTGQYVPKTRGEVARCIYESLAMKYRFVLHNLELTTGKNFQSLYVIGGGVKDRFLNTLTANACDREVIAGPVEATTIGNVIVQLIALGEISSLSQARHIVAGSVNFSHFEPQDIAGWDNASGYFAEKILKIC